MPSCVVVAVDPSSTSERAITLALSVVNDAVHSQFVFCHVIDIALMLARAERFTDDYQLALEAAQGDAKKLLDRCVAAADQAGVFGRSCVRYGKPAAEIVRLADSFAADLIVVGNRRTSRFHRVLREPVPDEIVRTTGIPVLVVAAGGAA